MDRKRYFNRKDKDFKNVFFHLVISYCVIMQWSCYSSSRQTAAMWVLCEMLLKQRCWSLMLDYFHPESSFLSWNRHRFLDCQKVGDRNSNLPILLNTLQWHWIPWKKIIYYWKLKNLLDEDGEVCVLWICVFNDSMTELLRWLYLMLGDIFRSHLHMQ